MSSSDSHTGRLVDPTETLGGDDPRLLAAVREYMGALENGERPSREEFLARYPDITRELAECLDGLELVHEAARDFRGSDPDLTEFTDEQLRTPLGDFRLIREIGRGGMGLVYEAEQLSLSRRVAVKILPFVASLDPTTLQRFRNEAQAAAQLHHPNIVPVYAVGAQRGVHFYAMQLIKGYALSALISELRRTSGRTMPDETPTPGPTMLDPFANWGEVKPTDPTQGYSSLKAASAGRPIRLRSVERIPADASILTATRSNPSNYFRTVAAIVQQAAAALDHAHRVGVVHRDIKPGNIMLDEQGKVWITDFGLAQLQSDSHLTRTGDMLGTLRYMSPEQASGDRVVLSHLTDIYSLGATLYELLTLEPVVAGRQRAELLRRILEDEPRPPRAVDRDIPVELETIVLKAISKLPGERYATAQQMADDLQHWLEDKPILARPPTLWDQAAKWQRRHRTLVRAVVVFLVLAGLGSLATTSIILRQQAEVTAAYHAEKLQRGAAEKSFRQARRAVDTFTRLGERELAGRPQLIDLRREFLETSLEYYKDFIEQRHGDPAAEAELKATSQRVTQIVDELKALEDFAPVMLLPNPRVQQELRLSPTQRDQITELMSRLVSRHPVAKAGTGATQSASAERAAGPELPLLDLLRSHQEKIQGVLNRHQWERLREIAWQQRGVSAFKSPEVIATLKLTSRQRDQIARVLQFDRPADSTQGTAGTPPQSAGRGSAKPSRVLSARLMDTALGVLTPEQLAAWKTMTGKPFGEALP